ncbi:cysteine desulfurase family protein [Marinicrinis lubricantis]|uniref:cysteine desulfurase n=1 Tax=Marinicrinis lubricantis TaxID=2086470 RepID=A0ABW1IVU4_9BACL
MERIYLDHAATTPLRPEVIEAMLPYFSQNYGNASSLHHFGREARNALNRARDLAAELLSCKPAELIFTSGGTESDNLAIIGSMFAQFPAKKHVITSKTEHHAVLGACSYLEKQGFDITYLNVDSNGLLSLGELERSIRPDTGLISVMYGNNETGVLQPIEQIGEIARSHGILFHVDAVQALGSIRIDLSSLPVDFMSFSAHKINGPKGNGLLYAAAKAPLTPHLHGGQQERKRRGGTENVPGIVGFAKALELAVENVEQKQRTMQQIRLTFVDQLKKKLGEDNVVLNGHPELRLPHIANISFIGTQTETMLMSLDLAGIAASSGSACTSGSLEISHVLKSMELADNITASAVRFSFGWGIEIETIDTAVKKIATTVERIRKTH